MDGQDLFATALQLVLPQSSGGRLCVVATTTDAAGAATRLGRAEPDLAMVDLLMPQPGGLTAITAVWRARPCVRAVATSGSADDELAAAALAGQSGPLRRR